MSKFSSTTPARKTHNLPDMSGINQRRKKIHGLAFEGGGVKGSAYVGAIYALRHIYDCSELKYFSGASAGAITATLMACDYTTEEINDIVLNLDWKSFKDDDIGFVRDLWRLTHIFGFAKGDVFEMWIKSAIKNKLDNEEATFMDLYNKTGNMLFVVGSDILNKKIVYFSKFTTPDTPIYIAVRMSMSIPIVFRPVKYNNSLWVDGGMLDNLPTTPLLEHIHQSDILALQLVGDDDKIYKLDEVTNIKIYAGCLLSAMMSLQKKVPAEYRIDIDTESISATNFDITEDQVETLINNGMNAVICYSEMQ